MKGNKRKTRGKRALSLVLALTLSVSGTAPLSSVEAKEAEEISTETTIEDKDYVVYIEVSDETQSDECSTVSENVLSGEVGTEDSVQAEEIQESIEDAEELILEQADGQELVKDEETIIYAADLTEKEINELEESDATIYVEENIELFGAESKSDKKENQKGKSDKSSHKSDDKDSDFQDDSEEKQQESSDMKEKKLAYKKSLSETKDEEPEWNISMVNAEDSAIDDETVPNETNEETSDSVKIAVMDSGIELLSGIPVQEIVNLVPDEQDLPYYMNDMTGHGTAVAGIINDIAPNAEIYSVKIMDAENKATLSRVVEGIYWCIENDIDIINMSFGTQTESQVLKKAIEDANKAGILIVSSAGNGGVEGVEYPAAYEEVIAVGAVDTTAQKTEESAVGEEVELVAPGEQIVSDSMLGLQTVVSGTSMAAPHVTAAAAVLWQKDTTKSADFIRGLLSQAANELGDKDEYGNGLVDLAYALEHYEEYAISYEEPIMEEKQDLSEAELKENEKTVSDNAAITSQNGLEENTKTISDALSEDQIIKENTTPVETFEDVDYVEGRWGKGSHEGLVNGAIAENGYVLSSEEMKVFKLGATYPDKAFPVSAASTNRNWHGGYGVNYIANYRFATKMAKYAGDTTKYSKTVGQTTDCFNQMKIQISATKVGDKTYSQIFEENSAVGVSYKNSTEDKKKKLRKMFLYGMASHIVTDSFAHSAFCRCGVNGTYIKVSNAHTSDDDVTVHPTRYKDAQEAMSMVILNYQYTCMGSEIDFSPRGEDWGKRRGYCLAKVLKYATEAAVDCTVNELNEAYKSINYEP